MSVSVEISPIEISSEIVIVMTSLRFPEPVVFSELSTPASVVPSIILLRVPSIEAVIGTSPDLVTASLISSLLALKSKLIGSSVIVIAVAPDKVLDIASES